LRYEPRYVQEVKVDADDGQAAEGLRHGPTLYSTGQVEMRCMHGHTRTHAHSHRQDDRAGVWRHVAGNGIGRTRIYRNQEATSRHPEGTPVRLVKTGTQEWHPFEWPSQPPKWARAPTSKQNQPNKENLHHTISMQECTNIETTSSPLPYNTSVLSTMTGALRPFNS
jgi:hypothetical protein